MAYLRSAATATVESAPPPDWVELTPFEAMKLPEPESVFAGARYLYVGSQVRMGAGPTEFFSRKIVEVVASEGLQSTAAVEVVFNPQHERFVAHAVRVFRGGKGREVPVDGFELFRRERDLERAIFDGRITAHLVIPDLRVGDVVETCYSLIGAHPVYKDRHTDILDMQWAAPVGLVERRLLEPKSREITFSYKGREPAYGQAESDGFIEHRWSASAWPGFRYEADTPGGWIGHSRVLVTDNLTWGEIADIYRSGYGAADLPAELLDEVRRIEAEEPTPQGRAIAALRFVQHELRYLAIGLGEGGLVPRPVDEIWTARFGDCKDASRLLTALFTAMGFDACPALVNTVAGRYLADDIPHLMAFNHCIVRLRHEGTTYWLDGTGKFQGGTLDKVCQQRLGWALPLTADAELEAMGEEPFQVLCEIEHQFDHRRSAKDPCDLTITCTVRSWRADGLRLRLANEGREAIARSYAEYYANRFGPMETLEPMRVTDRLESNELETVEVYRLLEPWTLSQDGKYLTFTAPDETVAPALIGARTLDRTAPIDMGTPRCFTQRTVIRLIEPADDRKFDDSWEVGPVSIKAKCATSKDKKKLTIDTSVTVSGHEMPANLARRYFDVSDAARDRASVALAYYARNGEFSVAGLNHGVGAWISSRKMWLVWAVLVCAYIALQFVNHFAGP